MSSYDLTIIGAGWAGFNAAIKAKESGLKVALIEKAQIGGTCLNRGCIPTKALIHSAKVFSLIKKAPGFGIEAPNPVINFTKMQEGKNKVVQQLQQGMQLMLNGIDVIKGEANILSNEEIKVPNQAIKSKYILVATGSRPYELGILKFDGTKVISSNEILEIKEIPESLLIVGGGVIGCEFASLFSALGAKVTLVEIKPQLLPEEDKEVSRKLELIFKKKGVIVKTNTDVSVLNISQYNLALVCVGRIAHTQNLGLENIGVNLDKGRIVTDKYLRTNISNIYAAGDCTAKIMLAHYASYQGRIAVENMVNSGRQRKIDATTIPNCIFTEPEIASVGLSEENAQGQGYSIHIHKFDFLGSGMARILNENEGFIKIISDTKTGIILGAAIIGPKATELIGILTLAVSSGLKIKDIKDTIFAHPTVSESIVEALK